MLVDLLSKRTKMHVQQVEDGMAVEANHVYVIRPGHTLTIKDGKLRLGKPLHGENERRNNHPIDDFFRSLAEEQRERAVGIVLSGMGSNGTAGAQEIKAVGGLCIAEDPDSAKFPSMPRSLIDNNLADFVLRPVEMPKVLARYANHPYAAGTKDPEQIARREQTALGEVLAVLRTRARHDFGGYKKPTLVRRIQRRMGLAQIERMSEYARSLRQNPGEIQALADDLQIHVTGFFRDPEAWEALRTNVIDPLVEEREEDAAIRCWITACSSGEEAYTLGILLLEAADRVGKHFDIKIFATDTAERSLAHARAGVFPGGIASEIAPDRLDRWFDKDDSNYRVKKEVRELVVFAPQNVTQDPPFSRLDIATCRNLMIYLEPEVQRRVLSLLHFGLREGGALLLGTSETVHAAGELFEPIDKKWRLYRRMGPTRHGVIDFPPPHALSKNGKSNGEASPSRSFRDATARPLTRASVGQLANLVLLERHTPPSVVIDRLGEIVYFHGDTGRFLAQPRGEPTRELLTLAKESVRGAVRSAMHKAVATNEPVTAPDGLLVDEEGHRLRIEVKAAPLEGRPGATYFLVSFTEHREPAPAPSPVTPEAGEAAELKEELARVHDELQSTIEELQTSNEEMKASNEEITSVNEEMQSANEELETSKEELQSLNEELTTVNAQLQAKMEELERTTNDLSSLLSSTDIAVVFLDRGFRIRRFTPAVLDLFELIPGDVGRPLNDLDRKFEDPDLLEDARRVLDKLLPIEREVRSDSGRWYVRRTLVYRTADNRIDGVVVTFVDITARHDAAEALRRGEERLRRATNVDGVAVNFYDNAGRLVETNDAYLKMQAMARADVAGGRLTWRDLTPRDYWDRTEAALKELAETGRVVPYEKQCVRKDGTRWWGLFAAARIDEETTVEYVLDITRRREDEGLLRQKEERLRFAIEAARMGFWDWDTRTDAVESDAQHDRIFGLPPGGAKPTPGALLGRIHRDDRDRVDAALRRAIEEQADYHAEFRVVDADGTVRWVAGYGRPYADGQERTVRVVGAVMDVTARKAAEAERLRLLEAERAARAAAESANAAKDDFLANVSHELRTPLSAILLWSKMLLAEAEEGGETREGLEAIERSARAQQSLIDDLLDTTRIAAGKVRLELRQIDLSGVVRAACDDIRPAAEVKDVTLDVRLDGGIGPVRADPERVQQVVWNLLSNAVKFTPAGGTVTLDLARSDGELEGSFDIRVRDTGKGIEADFLPRLFERFGQAEDGVGGARGGLGLGLAISRQLVELHGGTIRADSDGEGRGSTFTVTLPLGGVEEVAGAKAEAGLPLAGARVLLVAGAAESRDALAARLKEAGAEAESAASVEDALARFAARRPDAIVSGVGPAGGTLMRQVRTREARAGLPPTPALSVGEATAGFDRSVSEPARLVEVLSALLSAR